MIGEVHKNEVTKNDVKEIYNKYQMLSKDIDVLQNKIKYTVSVLKNVIFSISTIIF